MTNGRPLRAQLKPSWPSGSRSKRMCSSVRDGGIVKQEMLELNEPLKIEDSEECLPTSLLSIYPNAGW